MRLFTPGFICLTLAISSFLFVMPTHAQDKLPNGFTDHGVCSPISNHRGVVATTGPDGKNVVLVWLFDHRGGYELLMIDSETGKSEEFPVPFPPGGDTPYASLLSKKNKFYTLFNSYFSEFDPVKKTFTFHSKSLPKMAMSMTEDDNGLIWTVTYPNSGLVSFNPETKEFIDYGHLYKQNWPQYPRYLHADNKGWIYIGLGETASQFIAFNPKTKKATPLLSEDKRRKGQPFLYRDQNGKVYGQASRTAEEPWYELYQGEMKVVRAPEKQNPVSIITGSQGLFHDALPNGGKVKTLDLVDRKIEITNAKGKNNTYPISYASEGALVMDVFTLPNGTIAGGTAFPMRLFNYDPKTNKWMNEWSLSQFNVGIPLDNSVFFGVYPRGLLVEWNRSKPIYDDQKEQETSNPAIVAKAAPDIYRPLCIAVSADKKTVIMGGTPAYGYTGGGLLFWDRDTKKSVLLKDSALVLDQSAHKFAILPNNELLVGTTTEAGTGGERKATLAELYIIDIVSKKIKWRGTPFPGVTQYSDLYVRPDGMVYGMANRRTLFLFDPQSRKIVQQAEISQEFGGAVGGHSNRAFIAGTKGDVYLLFTKSILKIKPDLSVDLITKIPSNVSVGGDYLDGRIYFVLGSHLISYDLAYKK